MNILDLEMPTNDAAARTIRDYLRTLLTMLWSEEDSFSGKRPFGYRGWKYEIYAALVRGRAIEGALDEYGYIASVDEQKADDLILGAIQEMCRPRSED